MRLTNEYVLFWHGEFSNWYKCEFEYMGENFTSSEQAMMWMKANLFKDVEVANAIMRTNNPKEQKELGRRVRNFDADLWNRNALNYVTEICYYKFKQNAYLKTLLLSYPNLSFVEASPYDKVWGIGLHYDDVDAGDPTKWQGTNWLGIALNRAREMILSDMTKTNTTGE